MTTILLAHTPEMRRNYYGANALAGLQALGTVRLHEGEEPLGPAALIAAARDADIIVADRMTTGPAPIFAGLPKLIAMVRVAVDIRNIDVEAASAAGVLVTRAGPGFVKSVSEMVLGQMIDLARGISGAVRAYQESRMPEVRMGRQLAGSTLGIIGYGAIGRYLAPIGVALGMRVLVSDPYAKVEDSRFEHVSFEHLLGEAEYVICLAVATEATENLMNEAAFARMRPDAFFINASRGNLVDEAALETALRQHRIAGAGLDVGRAADQMPSPAIAGLPNVVATPHIAGLTPPAIEFQALQTVRQVAEIIQGRAPDGAVNEERWTRRRILATG